jgi:hypothetical protein
VLGEDVGAQLKDYNAKKSVMRALAGLRLLLQPKRTLQGTQLFRWFKFNMITWLSSM